MPRHLFFFLPTAVCSTALAVAILPLVFQPGAARAQAADMPDSHGKEQLESLCTACHSLRNVTRSLGYSRDEWRELISTMVDFSGDLVLRAEITTYLGTHFQASGNRAATLVPGGLSIGFEEWQVPTLGQRARDPIEAPDGTIWWAGQWGNLIGRIDPETGDMKEYPLPKGSYPHSVTLDAAGNVWYTGNKNGTVGYLDPKTEQITVYPMPDPAARDPHTAIFDAAGILWFTLQQSNMIGRLDPDSGDIRLVTPPTSGSRPYGIKIDRTGTPWVACNGSNCLLKVDPETMAITEIELPTPGTTVRRLDIAADGMIWYVNSGRGKLGRYDPASGAIKEWDSPSGPESHPYAIAVVDGIVWYNESGVRPDALVRFDPKTETFQSWAIPSGDIYAGIVRNMRPTHDGNLLIHQTATNRIIRVDLKHAAPTQ